MNYWDRHIGDIIRDTVSLTMLEDGAYNRLLDQYYQTERPLSLDRKMIYRLARAVSAPERKAVDFVIETFFREGPDGWHQKRCDAEIARYQDKQSKAKASANARWNRSDGNANASKTHDANDMRTHSEGNAHQTPVASSHTPDLKPEVESSVVHTIPREDNQHGSTPVSRAIEIAVYLRQRGVVGANSVNPYIAAWGDDARVTNEILDAAISKGRMSLEGKPLGPNYLAMIVPDLLNPKPVKTAERKFDDWHKSPAGIDRKAKELGMSGRGNEGYDSLRERIWAELRKREQQGAAA